jgi:hypothetical protein
MTTISVLILALSITGQAPEGFSGRWVADDTRMTAGADAVGSAIDAHRLPRQTRTPLRRELEIAERVDAVEVGRPDAARLALPLTGAAVRTTERSGKAVTARALREGAVLVIRREHALRLPDGSPVTITVEERHELLADGTLQVTTTSTTGTLVHTERTIYRRVR